MKIFKLGFLLMLLVAIVSFTVSKKNIQDKQMTDPEYVGKFTWCDPYDDQCFIIRVWVDGDNTSVVIEGQLGLGPSYTATGTYSNSGGRYVTNFAMQFPRFGGGTYDVSYTGNLTYP